MPAEMIARAHVYRERLNGTLVDLLRFRPEDVGDDYLRWMQDPEVTRYIQARFQQHDIGSLQRFVAGFDHRDRFIFAIQARETGERIGTFTLRVDPVHRFSSIGYLIGARAYWQGGFALDACRTGLDFVFFERKVRRVFEPTTANHLASNFNFKRLGFAKVATVPSLYWGGDRYQDATYWMLSIEDWAAQRGRPAPDIPNPDRP